MMLSAVPLAMVGLFNDMNSKFRSAASLESSVVFRWCIIYYTSFYNNKLLQILFALPGWIDWSVSDWHSIIKSLVYSDLSNHKSTDQVLGGASLMLNVWQSCWEHRQCSTWWTHRIQSFVECVPIKQQHCSSQPTTHNHHDMSVLLCDSESKLCNTCHWFSVWCC